ncbi:Hypothetical predicted protein [Paramuricea clavata]|uniref:Uncharacterized protein n=1 Tax=Paramuricea clavata TaxID=317549 RepID=A0A6S7FPU0_PARCT|nr:Hypothetical predicted protein [Paramuricea clavata]
MKSIGERDFSVQETMHLLSQHSHLTYKLLPINLNGSLKIETNLRCIQDSMLDIYGKREVHQNNSPDIMKMNSVTFAANYKVSKGKLIKQSTNVVPRIFPNYSPNPSGDNYGLYCRYQLLKYKPCSGSQNDASNSDSPDNDLFINAWCNFLHSPFAKANVPEWGKNHNALENYNQSKSGFETVEKDDSQEQWMIISDIHSSLEQLSKKQIFHDWKEGSLNYSQQQLGEMLKWIKTTKEASKVSHSDSKQIDVSTFSSEQKLS